MKIKDYDWQGILERVCSPLPDKKVIDWFVEEYDIEVKDDDDDDEPTLDDFYEDDIVEHLEEKGYKCSKVELSHEDDIFSPAGMAQAIQQQQASWIRDFLFELAGIGQNGHTIEDCVEQYKKLI